MIPLNRRHAIVSTFIAASEAMAEPTRSPGALPYQAVAFDAFPIFDLRSVTTAAEATVPGKGTELVATWRTRQFEYQWLRALSQDYADFSQATRDSLNFAIKALRLSIDESARERLLESFSRLTVWPDVPVAIQKLRDAGLRVLIVSNMTKSLLDAGLNRAGLSREFDFVLTTDAIRSYKPDPRAYQLSVDALGIRREEILFVPFAGWDAAGAKAFGHPTFWLNRFGAPAEELGQRLEGMGKDMEGLLQFLQLV